MKTTFLATLALSASALILAISSDPNGVWTLDAEGQGAPFLLELETHAGVVEASVWRPGAPSAQRVTGVRRSGMSLLLDLPPSFAGGQTLEATLGPAGTMLRARITGSGPTRFEIERTQHAELGEAIAEEVRSRCAELADRHLEVLRSGTPEERRTAATQLAEGGLEMIPVLLNAVAKSDGSWSEWAALSLRQLGTEAIPPLGRALHYENEVVARVAAEALAAIGCQQCGVEPDLRQVARNHSDARVRRAAREALRPVPSA